MSYNTVSLSNGDGSVQQFGGGGGGSSTTSATAVSYNNSESGLAATNVQDAIDELAETPAGSTAVLNITTTSTEFYGQTITVSNSQNTYTGKFSSSGQATIYVSNLGTYTVSCQTSSTSVTIAAIGAVYSVQLELLYSTINVTCMNSDLFGQDLTVSFGGSEVGTIPIDSEGNGSYRATQLGTYTISYTGQPSTDVTVSEFGVTLSAVFGIALATFAAATEQQIADMVAAADAGLIDLYEDAGWRVGQSRTVQLSAISKRGSYDDVSWSVPYAQPIQSIELVLMHRGLYTLVNPVLNKDGTQRTTCSFICGVKDVLSERSYMNEARTNVGSWPASALYGLCNGGFRQALPTSLRGCFKKFNTITGDRNGTTAGGPNITSQDYFALPAAKEVFGYRAYSGSNEANALTQFTWYETSANLVKYNARYAANQVWWERSPYSSSGVFCSVNTDGSAFNSYADAYYGISPFGCL